MTTPQVKDEQRPTYYVSKVLEPEHPWNDERFDDDVTPKPTSGFRIAPPLDPQPVPLLERDGRVITEVIVGRVEWHLLRRLDESICLYYTKSDDPAQYVVWDSLDEPKSQENMRIANAARLALGDILQLIGSWPYPGPKHLRDLITLRDLLQSERWEAIKAEPYG